MGMKASSLSVWGGLTPHTDKLLAFMPKKDAPKRPAAA